jgi:hypothetical protein
LKTDNKITSKKIGSRDLNFKNFILKRCFLSFFKKKLIIPQKRRFHSKI